MRGKYYNPMEDKMEKYVFGMVMYLNLELSEWFMIKSKQQPLMSLCNLFKYLFVCELFHCLLSFRLCTESNTIVYVYNLFFCVLLLLLFLQVTLNTFRHISTCNKTKQKKKYCLPFASISQFFFSYFISCSACVFVTGAFNLTHAKK